MEYKHIPSDFAETAEFRQQSVLERYRPAVDAYLHEFLLENTGEHSNMVDYHMGIRDQEGNLIEGASQGKALRPAICLLTVDALVDNWEQALPAAAGLQIFHDFTLIHDDIEDGDLWRRDQPTVWGIHGIAQGINAGDATHILSNLALSDLEKQGVSAQTILDAKNLLDRTGLRVVQGQILDVSFEKTLNVSVEDYLRMISGKTGILIESSIMMGTLFGSVDDRTKENLRLYGAHVGRAFQISDDQLGIWGNPEKTGKPVGSDIIHRKKSLPIVMLLNTEDSIVKNEMMRIYKQEKPLLDENDVTRVLEILDTAGMQEQVKAALDVSYTAAVTTIKQADVGWAEKDYLELAKKLSYREK